MTRTHVLCAVLSIGGMIVLFPAHASAQPEFGGIELTSLNATVPGFDIPFNGGSVNTGPISIQKMPDPSEITPLVIPPGETGVDRVDFLVWEAIATFSSSDPTFNELFLGGDPSAPAPVTLIGPAVVSPVSSPTGDLTLFAVDVGVATFPGMPGTPMLISNNNTNNKVVPLSQIPVASEFSGTFRDPSPDEIAFQSTVRNSLLSEAVALLGQRDPAQGALFTPEVVNEIQTFYDQNPSTELAIGVPTAGAASANANGTSMTLIGAELGGSDSFKTYRPADADGDDNVTVLGDGSALVGNLGVDGAGWRGGDFNFDGLTTVLTDGAVLVEKLGTPFPSGAAEEPLPLAPVGTAVATYNPFTGVVTIDATGQLILGLKSAGGNLLSGGNNLGGTLDESVLSSELGWIDFGGFTGSTLDAGQVVKIGTDVSDLTFLYQNSGGSLTTGTINVIPEPASLVLLALAVGWMMLGSRRRAA